MIAKLEGIKNYIKNGNASHPPHAVEATGEIESTTIKLPTASPMVGMIK